MCSRFRDFVAKERFLIGASLLRIAIGIILLYNYLIHYNQRHFLWTNSGINAYSDEFKRFVFSLYNWSDSLLYFDFVYHVGVVITFVYLIRYKGRLFNILNFVFFYSIYNRMLHISDGGDNLLAICLFFLLFANGTAYFSLDAHKFQVFKENRKHTFKYQFSSILHNFAILFCIIQLCFVYFISALYQIMGELWQNGTAMYYIAQVDEFSRPILRDMVDSYLWAIILFTYASIIMKIAFPFTIMNKIVKPFMVGGMVAFHLGIGIGMGLLTFSLIMIVMEFLVFTDEEYKNMYRSAIRIKRKVQLYFLRRSRAIGYRYFQAQRVIVFYDGWCPLCQGMMARCKRMDYFRLLVCTNFRDPSVIERYDLDQAEVEKRMHSARYVNASLQHKGIDAVIQICKRLLPLWLFVPVFIVSSKLGMGGLLYDYVASRRKLVPVAHCHDNVCRVDLPTFCDGKGCER
ncbi:DCC1-like thiol-disulfide oxidoreductase family protein [Paenibacillus popilliae]|uniref:DCC1-like thiol-disulfide oxidoreductase family protein n=1 Tax=Paenibacillus popilliae TaxID=78057 RepID=UPI0002DECA81|nr:DCC1-like thiol-disulfide oxidoreductase family protein [Paenibacillus popilliae]